MTVWIGKWKTVGSKGFLGHSYPTNDYSIDTTIYFNFHFLVLEKSQQPLLLRVTVPNMVSSTRKSINRREPQQGNMGKNFSMQAHVKRNSKGGSQKGVSWPRDKWINDVKAVHPTLFLRTSQAFPLPHKFQWCCLDLSNCHLKFK